MEWAGSSHLFCFSFHSGQTTCLFPASFPPSSSTLLVSLCFLFLCLYKQFLLLKFIPQSSHWNLVIPSQLGGGTESAESALEESYPIIPWEVGCVDAGAGAGGPVLGDGWELETLFSEGLACGQACGLLLCAGLVGSGRVKRLRLFCTRSEVSWGPWDVSRFPRWWLGPFFTWGNRTWIVRRGRRLWWWRECFFWRHWRVGNWRGTTGDLSSINWKVFWCMFLCCSRNWSIGGRCFRI